ELQRRAPREVLGRLSAVDVLLHTGTMSLGALLLGGIVDATGSEALGVAVPVALAVLGYAATAGRTSSRRANAPMLPAPCGDRATERG
ncbi:MAG: hypothetical protein KC619_08095, partial [Myxococcales bacterium]|nr:hypothetical protein [Myxococcales bacterium]